jgi:tetratricopeptide (TPR) repeat protein
VNLSYAIEYRFFGVDPYFYHADNLIIHLLNTLFVFFIFFRLTKKNFYVSFITAFIFACHPLHVEPVAWISGRKDTLYAFFFLGSWLMYLKTYSEQGRKYVLTMAVSLFLFLCACLSKSMAVTLPAVLILCDWFYGRRFDKDALLRYLPFLLVAVIFSLSTYMLYYTPTEKSYLTMYALFVNFVSAHFNVLFYMAKFILPVKLSAIYPYFYDLYSNPPIYILYSPALLYSIFVLIIYSLKKTKVIFFGFAFFIITILPVINILPTGFFSVADRYAYVPLIGFGYIAAAFICYLYGIIKKKSFKVVFVSAVSAVLAIMCFASYSRAEKWLNTKALFDDMVSNYPGQVSRAYATRNIEFKNENRLKDAEKDLEMALYLDPADNVALYTLGTVKAAQKKYNDALKIFASLSSQDPNLDKAYMHTARIYSETNHKEEAFRIINEGIERFPKAFALYDILGLFYAHDKNYDKAIEAFQKSKRLHPGNKYTYIYLAQIYEILADYTLAEKEYSDGIKNSGENRDVMYVLGDFYFDFKEYYKAREIFTQIVQKYPEDFESFDYLGRIESLYGNYKKTLYYYTMAILINNAYAPSYFNRASAHMNMGDYALSYKDARKAVDLGYNIPEDYIKELKDKSGLAL